MRVRVFQTRRVTLQRSWFVAEVQSIDPQFLFKLGFNERAIPVIERWTCRLTSDDHHPVDLVEFLREVEDRYLIGYLSDEILREANEWQDDHGRGVRSRLHDQSNLLKTECATRSFRYNQTQRIRHPVVPVGTTRRFELHKTVRSIRRE